MKYKNINAALHNFGHSFLSLMNYIDEGHVLDDLAAIHGRHHDIEINWLTGKFSPAPLITARIARSIAFWQQKLPDHLRRHSVDLAALTALALVWPARARQHLLATDDRGSSYRIEIRETH